MIFISPGGGADGCGSMGRAARNTKPHVPRKLEAFLDEFIKAAGIADDKDRARISSVARPQPVKVNRKGVSKMPTQQPDVKSTVER